MEAPRTAIPTKMLIAPARMFCIDYHYSTSLEAVEVHYCPGKALSGEDGFKPREHFITNEPVEGSEAGGGVLPLGRPRFFKCYRKGDSDIELWFRSVTTEGNGCDFPAVFCFATSLNSDAMSHEWGDASPVGVVNDTQHWYELCVRKCGQDEGRALVFVVVPESIEDIERVRLGVHPLPGTAEGFQ